MADWCIWKNSRSQTERSLPAITQRLEKVQALTENLTDRLIGQIQNKRNLAQEERIEKLEKKLKVLKSG